MWGVPFHNGEAITSYAVQLRNPGTYEWTSSSTSINSTTTTYTVLSLGPNSVYEFQVQAYNSNGAGAWSASAIGTTQAALPGQPIDVVGTNPTLSSVDLSWTAPSSGGLTTTQYTVYIQHGVGMWDNGTATGSGSTSYTVTGLVAGVSYRFKVSATNSLGAGAIGPASAVVR